MILSLFFVQLKTENTEFPSRAVIWIKIVSDSLNCTVDDVETISPLFTEGGGKVMIYGSNLGHRRRDEMLPTWIQDRKHNFSGLHDPQFDQIGANIIDAGVVKYQNCYVVRAGSIVECSLGVLSGLSFWFQFSIGKEHLECSSKFLHPHYPIISAGWRSFLVFTFYERRAIYCALHVF